MIEEPGRPIYASFTHRDRAATYAASRKLEAINDQSYDH